MKKRNDSFFSIFLCLCSVHMCVSTYVSTHCLDACVCVCTCLWRTEADVRNFLHSSSTLFSEAGSLKQTQSSPIWLRSLSGLFWRSHFIFLRLELQAGHVGSGDPNSIPHICKTNIFTTQAGPELTI